MQMPGWGQGGGEARLGVGAGVGGSAVGLGRVGIRVLVGVGVTGVAVGGCRINCVGVGSYSGGRGWDGKTANLSKVNRTSKTSITMNVVRARFSRAVASSLSRVKIVSVLLLCASLISRKLNKAARRPAA